MSQVTLTLSFATMAEAAAFLSGAKLPAGASAGATTTAASTPATGAKATKPATAAADAYTPVNTHAEMTAQLNLVKEKFGTVAAKAIIGAAGAAKMADITDPKKIDAAYKAATEKMAESVPAAAADDDM